MRNVWKWDFAANFRDGLALIKKLLSWEIITNKLAPDEINASCESQNCSWIQSFCGQIRLSDFPATNGRKKQWTLSKI